MSSSRVGPRARSRGPPDSAPVRHAARPGRGGRAPRARRRREAPAGRSPRPAGPGRPAGEPAAAERRPVPRWAAPRRRAGRLRARPVARTSRCSRPRRPRRQRSLPPPLASPPSMPGREEGLGSASRAPATLPPAGARRSPCRVPPSPAPSADLVRRDAPGACGAGAPRTTPSREASWKPRRVGAARPASPAAARTTRGSPWWRAGPSPGRDPAAPPPASTPCLDSSSCVPA